MSAISIPGRIARRLRSIAASQVRTRTLRLVNEQPIVSFSFDDFPRSAATTGATILAEHGVCGTFYLSSRLLAAGDGCTVDDLVRLLDHGHELGCHTASHVRVSRLNASELRRELDENAAFVAGKLGDTRMTTFAYPFGDMSLPAKLALQGRFAACRSTRPGVSRGVADLGALPAVKLYSRLIDAAQVGRLVKEALRPRSWLIFYTHDVADAPSDVGCDPRLLDAAVRAAVAGGARVLPVRNALGLARFGA